MVDDPFAALCGTSDNAAYVAFGRWHASERAPETTLDDVARLDLHAERAERAGGSGDRAAGAEGGSPLARDVGSDGPRSPRPDQDGSVRERVHDEPVRAILPTTILAERDLDDDAAAARALGLPVGPESGDDGATLALKGRLARLHLRASEEGMHARALETLDAIASGEVRAKHVTKKGDVVEVDLHPRFRSSAAKAILATATAAARTQSGKVEIGNAQIVAAGDLIATVDPARLRAAVKRLRGG